jgi:hypothetical protein
MKPPTLDYVEKTIGTVAKAWRWASGIWTAPARIRALEAKVKDTADGRLQCVSCGTGRLGDVRFHAIANSMAGGAHVAKCDSCSRWFEVDLKERRVVGTGGDYQG